jgi:hypothetical protein
VTPTLLTYRFNRWKRMRTHVVAKIQPVRITVLSYWFG